MELMLTLLLVLSAVVLPILIRVLTGKKRQNMAWPPMDLLAQGPRYRSGAITYNQSRSGVRTNVEVENPNTPHSARYKRRHNFQKHKETKPWMK